MPVFGGIPAKVYCTCTGELSAEYYSNGLAMAMHNFIYSVFHRLLDYSESIRLNNSRVANYGSQLCSKEFRDIEGYLQENK